MSDNDTWPWQPIECAPKNGDDILVCCGPAYDPMYAVVAWEPDGSYFEDGQPGWMMWWKQEGKYCAKASWAQFWQPIAPTPDDPRS